MSPRSVQYGAYPNDEAPKSVQHGRGGALAHGRHQPPHHTRSHDHTYTLGHGGRQVRLGPVAFWTVVGTVVIMAGWTVVTATYFAFRDDVLTRLIARHAEMQYAYEDRIADMRAQIDRTTSRQLLDQEQVERKLDQILRRQATLESRTSTLTSVPDATITGSIKQPAAKPAEPPAMPKPSPISDTVIFAPPPDREARLESRGPAATAATYRLAQDQRAPDPKIGGIGGVLTRLQTSLDSVERRHAMALAALEDAFDTRLKKLRGVFGDLGLDMGEMEKATPRSGVGGPFVPLKPAADAGAFERQLYRIQLSRAQVDRISRVLAHVPYRKPVLGIIETSSGFGVRADPFSGRPAMHTGLDFRAGSGDPVRVTANGRVSTAGWSGGYGQMVEVDHGNGLSTRYGHLSEIKVKVGEQVRIGQIIGAIGSTGRSTGPHLHYETRVEGDAVDPQKFLRAGIRLGSS